MAPEATPRRVQPLAIRARENQRPLIRSRPPSSSGPSPCSSVWSGNTPVRNRGEGAETPVHAGTLYVGYDLEQQGEADRIELAEPAPAAIPSGSGPSRCRS